MVAALRALEQAHVWVVGDLIRDIYVRGDARRISPEAPVPVIHVSDESASLGGAGNVARGIRALGGRVTIAGVVGRDSAGDAVIAAAEARGIHAHGIVRDDRPTTEKVRVIAHDQQVLRYDREVTTPLSAVATESLFLALDGAEPPGIIAVSDYAKGVVTERLFQRLVALASRHSVPLIVDPKHTDFSVYHGATGLTPNHLELERASGRAVDPSDDDAVAAAAARAAREADPDWLLATLGPHGMAVWRRGQPLLRVPAVGRRVYDVTGAGDTVLAALAASLATGLSLEEAAVLANHAAGLSVERPGAVEIGVGDIAADPALGGTAPGYIDIDAIDGWIGWWRLAGKRIVFTNGCFDLLHSGHLTLLEKSAELGDVLIVGLNSDASVTRLKGPARPLVAEPDRARILAALAVVDAVVAFDQDTPLELIRRIRPDVLVKGGDYAREQVVGGDEVEAWGGRLVLVDLVEGRSTSALVERMQA